MVNRTSVLGGESKSRGLLGGRRSRKVTGAWITLGVTAAFLVLFARATGVVISVVLALILVIATMDTGSGSTPYSRWQDRRRMKYRRRRGFDRFLPVAWRPEGLNPSEGATRRERAESLLQYNAYRDFPDGVDGVYFLEKRPGRAAVAYHVPIGEAPYLSVAFSVDGPIQGQHGDAFVAQAQWAFGQLLAGWGAAQKLVTGLQTVTRVLPSDSAFHEVWLEGQIDPEAPAELQEEYGQLLDQLSAGSFVQRHFVVIRWDADGRFRDLAARRGPGVNGMLDVIKEQLDGVQRRLEDAMYQNVKPLSGPQLGAVLRHLQHPDWSIDRASDVNVDSCWLASHDEWSYTEVVSEAPDPLNPLMVMDETVWLHRTARIPVTALEVKPVDGLWQSPILTGMEEQIVRTLSTHLYLVPAREAKVGARRDATLDRADLIAQERKGRLIDDEAALALSSALRRESDLHEGGGHHGALWAQFITLSARNVEELTIACGQLEEACDEAGISRLDWFDTLQSAAQSTTWPLARGMAPPKRSNTTKAMTKVSSGTAKEGITV